MPSNAITPTCIVCGLPSPYKQCYPCRGKAQAARHRAPIRAGDQFNRWTVVAPAPSAKGGGLRFLCRCACGTPRVKDAADLRRGHSKSCGCYNREVAAMGCYRHGLADHALYRTWVGMIHRCSDPKHSHYANYGGRGIEVCERWRDLALFIADIGDRPSPKHQIDRIDNDGHYEPGNVRWSTAVQQGTNRRTNRFLTFEGRTLTITEWGRELGIGDQLIRARLARGWSIADAFRCPAHGRTSGQT